MNIYLICGYGIPEDIAKDQQYLSYLHLAFNKMYSESANQEAVIITCGGPTRCEEPFEGTEAGVMAEYVRGHMGREELQGQTSQWQVLEEDKSLSTLENIVLSKELIASHQLEGEVFVFCEATREGRVKVFGEEVFGDRFGGVLPIDFDVTKNRYLSPEVLQKKEELSIMEAMWTLEDSDRIKKHHELYEKKFVFFRERQAAGVSHVDVVEEWFVKGPEMLKELMPDHPLLNR